jgi:hypothetical protein
VIAHFGSRQKTIVQMQLAAKELSVSMQSNCVILRDSRKATISAHLVKYAATIDIQSIP